MTNLVKLKQSSRLRRHKRIRAKVKGTAERPRLSIFRSNKYIYAQLIDDEKGETLLRVDSRKIKKTTRSSNRVARSNDRAKTEKEKIEEIEKSLTGKVAAAYEVGKLIAKEAAKKKIKKIIFDRGGYKYHGRVKAVAEGAREEGLQF